MSDDIDLTSADDLLPFPVLDGPSDVSRRRFELWRNGAENSLLWDITLVAADGRAFPASRLELASWSEYFCKIFQGITALVVALVISSCMHKTKANTRLVGLKGIMQRPGRQC